MRSSDWAQRQIRSTWHGVPLAKPGLLAPSPTHGGWGLGPPTQPMGRVLPLNQWGLGPPTQPMGGRGGPVSVVSELISVALLLTLALGGLNADLLVVLLEGGEVFAGFGKLTLLHALADVPVDEGPLRVHEVELVVDPREDLCDGGGVADHAARAHDLRQVSARDHGRRLVIDAALEARGAPVHELDRALRLDGGNRCIDVLGDDVSAIHHTAGHILAVARGRT